MNSQLKAKLETKMREWMEDNLEADEWPDAYFGDRIVPVMTDAAASVFDAVVESQDYALHEGFLTQA